MNARLKPDAAAANRALLARVDAALGELPARPRVRMAPHTRAVGVGDDELTVCVHCNESDACDCAQGESEHD